MTTIKGFITISAEPETTPELPAIHTLDQLIAKLQAEREVHGGDIPVRSYDNEWGDLSALRAAVETTYCFPDPETGETVCWENWKTGSRSETRPGGVDKPVLVIR